MSNQTRAASPFLLSALVLAWGIPFVAFFAQTVSAAPSRLDCQGVSITVPAAGATLSGTTEIRGQAVVPNFQFYKVEYSPVEREQWVLIGVDVVRTPVRNGLLVSWQTATVPEGVYRLRLRAVDLTGNYCEALVTPLTVVRMQPTEALPEPTETVALFAVPPLPTPTVLLSTPVVVAPVLSQPGAVPTRGLPVDLPNVNVPVLGGFFLFGVLVMLAVLLFVGLVLFVRRWG